MLAEEEGQDGASGDVALGFRCAGPKRFIEWFRLRLEGQNGDIGGDHRCMQRRPSKPCWRYCFPASSACSSAGIRRCAHRASSRSRRCATFDCHARAVRAGPCAAMGYERRRVRGMRTSHDQLVNLSIRCLVLMLRASTVDALAAELSTSYTPAWSLLLAR